MGSELFLLMRKKRSLSVLFHFMTLRSLTYAKGKVTNLYAANGKGH